MIRQHIFLDYLEYIVDLYKAHIDLNDEQIYKSKFVMLRRYDIVNKVAEDSDIYFIERSIVEKLLSDDANDIKIAKETLCFPTTEDTFQPYSQDYKMFNEDYIEKLFRFNDDGYGDIYSLLDENGNSMYIECDTVRIYHPNIQKSKKYIIHFDNYINNIHFHYFCQTNKNQAINSENEFKYNNNIYSEYYEIHIPNIEFLFGDKKHKNVSELFLERNGYLEQLEDPDTHEEYEDWNPQLSNHPEQFKQLYLYNDENDEYEPINLDVPYDKTKTYYLRQYSVYYREDLNLTIAQEYDKTFDDSTDDIKVLPFDDDDNDVKTQVANIIKPVNYLIQPYILVQDIKNSILRLSQVYKKIILPKNPVRIENNYITYPITCTLYPYTEISDENNVYMPDEDTLVNSDVFITESKFRLSSKLGFDKDGTIAVINQFLYPNKEQWLDESYSQDEALQKAYCFYNNITNKEYVIEENTDDPESKEVRYRYNDKICSSSYVEDERYEDEDDDPTLNKIKICGFHINIFTDLGLKNCILSFDVQDNFIINFAFKLWNYFTSWDQLPDVLVIQTYFEDKYIGCRIYGNAIGISKEWFKYFINAQNISRLTLNKLYNAWEGTDMETFNFVDKISCIVKKENADNKNLNNNLIIPKIIYKPVFYKVQDLQKIQIRNGLTQKIGINLGNYMTKVETFKITLGGLQVVECARNDIYVIFEIIAGALNTNSGVYNISNQDDEYISSGNWILV